MNEADLIAFPARAAAPDDRLGRAAALLRAHVRCDAPEPITRVSLDELLDDGAAGPWAELDSIRDTFGLSRFETALLVTLAAISVDPALAANCAAIQGLAHTGAIPFAFADRLLPEGRLADLRPGAPLRLWQLIEPVGAAEAAAASLFRIEERLLFHLAGADLAGEPLARIDPAGWLAPSEEEAARRLAALLGEDGIRAPRAIQLCGNDPGALRDISAAAGTELGRDVLAISAAALPANRTELAAFARRCSRDARLTGAILLVEANEASPEAAAAAAQFAAMVEPAVIVATAAPLSLPGRPGLRLDIAPPSFAERRAHWDLLAPRIGGAELDKIARTFLLPGAGRAAAAALAGRDADAAALWRACRSQSRQGLDGLAERIGSSVGWDDLVLPEAQGDLLRDIVDHVEFAGLVFDSWRFEARLNRGTGVAALFAGPSGTGKTLAAEVLANALERDLYRIDLSQVVSKYIGETEKNLSRIFAAAESGGAILLFDEADALFGKRSEVQDSHDRYANIEISYLLQRMETYNGLSILTTNLRDALDKAFLRRLRFIVQFAYPNADQRRRIWQRVFPSELPTRDLDYARLSQYDLTGGAIRNVALAAAFLAARDGGPLTMAHCVAAATREYQKLEKPLGNRGQDRARP